MPDVQWAVVAETVHGIEGTIGPFGSREESNNWVDENGEEHVKYHHHSLVDPGD